MQENKRNLEIRLSPNYEPIPELLDVASVMREYASTTIDSILENPDNGFDIVIPLNGSIIPLYYLYEHLITNYPDKVDNFTDSIIFMQDVKDSKSMAALLFNKKNSPNGAYLIDDIADKLHVVGALTDVYPTISVFAPVQKRHTADYQAALPKDTPSSIVTTTTTDDRWIASGCGMNEGEDRGNGYQNALLSTYQRFAKTGFFKQDLNNLTAAEKILFYQNQLLPDFTETDDLFLLCFQMETLKNNADFDGLIHLSRKVIPTIKSALSRRKMPSHITT